MASTSSQRLAEPADHVLVRRISDGDEDALVVLYRRYVDAIYRFVLAQVRDVQDAEDMTSETFARMLRSLDGFRGEASFKNWLYQIARNAVRNHRRSAGYRRSVPLSPHLADEPLDEPHSSREDRETALALLEPLPPRYRQVLELRFLDGHSIEETARRMSITVGNAKVLQHRALRKAADTAAAAKPKEAEVDARSAK
jgi:RNA polymerase sigma-70 factor (ECF subfamily)